MQLQRVWSYVVRVFRMDLEVQSDLIRDAAFQDAEMRGHKAWILAAAILIASLGLNADSTAVVIGAMLISPLMGPVVGIGLAVRLWDLALLRRSVRSLSIAIVVSIAVSALFFVFSPFVPEGNELMARTTPTLLDALIAVVGGIAGAVALIRRDRSNVVPGVAIATALMPPLCTVGYGIATAQITVALGAFYLFFINGVCISVATFGVAKLLPMQGVAIDSTKQASIHRWIMLFVGLTLIPASVISWSMISASLTQNSVDRMVAMVRAAFPSSSVIVTRQDIQSEEPRVELAIVGPDNQSDVASMVDSVRVAVGLGDVKVVIHGVTPAMAVGVGADQMLQLYASTERARRESRQQLDSVAVRLRDDSLRTAEAIDVAREVQSLFPAIRRVAIAPTAIVAAAGQGIASHGYVDLVWQQRPNVDTETRLHDWFRTRLRDSSVVIRSGIGR